MAKEEAALDLKRIMVQPGWLLIAQNPDDPSRARVMGFPSNEEPRLSDGEAFVSVDENAILVKNVTLPAKMGKIGALYLVPAPQVGALIAPEPKTEKSALIVPNGAKP